MLHRHQTSPHDNFHSIFLSCNLGNLILKHCWEEATVGKDRARVSELIKEWVRHGFQRPESEVG